MKNEDFDNYKFAKDQIVYYKKDYYNLLGVDFENNRVCILIKDVHQWIDCKEVKIFNTPF